MANIASARKRARQSEKRRLRNASRRSGLRTSVKKVVTAIQKKDKEAAIAAYKKAVPVIDHMTGMGMIHKSRLNAQIRAL